MLPHPLITCGLLLFLCYERTKEPWQWTYGPESWKYWLSEKMFYRHCLCLACSSIHFSHEYLSHSSCSSLNITTSSRSPFLSCVVAPIIFLYHCILFSSFYFIGKYLFTGLSVPKVQGSDAFYLSIHFLYLSQSLANNKYFWMLNSVISLVKIILWLWQNNL